MQIEKKDLEKFKKLKISNILELLLITPQNYYDFRVKNYPVLKSQNLVLINIYEVVKNPKYLKIIAFSINFKQNIELIFFRYNSYHLKSFSQGSTMYIYGKVEQNFSKLQIIQPKKISEKNVGKIYTSYKTQIRADIFKNLIDKYLNFENLQKYNIPEKYVKNALTVHYPNEEFFSYYLKYKTFPKEIIEALKFIEIYNYLKKLKRKKRVFPALMRCSKEIEGFLENIPFKLTDDQLKAIYDIKEDLKKQKAARRVIIGDVGSGKSMVMFAAAYLTFPNRAILMAPTTILANQLYEEAKKYLKNLKIALVTSSSKDEDLEDFHFIIGTHALLYKKLPKACVIMVDEQHRFGTNQRNLLNKLISSKDRSPHFFQFSATPIPRTKALIDSELVDFSFIKQTPFKKDITTKVISKDDFKELLLHIKKEILKKHQVLIVYPLIESKNGYKYKSLEEAASFWRRYFDNVYITHGKDKEKEDILIDFRDKGDILLSTTVVEVGISLPRLSTVVIVGAENLGLATLHQLRGRVSRTGIKGYCFLYTNDKNNKRLQEFSKISSGFEIAELDLKYRKSGDILQGYEQSGKSFRWIDLSEDRSIIEEAKKIVG